MRYLVFTAKHHGIGYGLGYYRQMTDNQMPVFTYQGLWETPAILNDTWGYSSVDDNR